MGTSTNWRELEQRILKAIKTSVRPVAVAFLDAVPEGVKEGQSLQIRMITPCSAVAQW